MWPDGEHTPTKTRQRTPPRLTSNLKWADRPGTVLLRSRATGLPKDSVASVAVRIVCARRSARRRRRTLNRFFGSVILHEITPHGIEQFKRARISWGDVTIHTLRHT